MSGFSVKSPAKINLYLKILGGRADGYHNIETVFERISLCDSVRFCENSTNRIELSCSSDDVPLDRDSLIYRCVDLVRKECNLSNRGISIEIDKNIPIASGLGGGSSNAAAVVLGLNKFWKLNLNKHKLLKLGKILGADVCFFLLDVSLAVGRERGDEITSLPAAKKVLWHILAVPNQKISSSAAYDSWEEKNTHSLTGENNGLKMVTYALGQGNLALLRSNLYNSLEIALKDSCSIVKEVKQEIENLGLRNTLMSGSGPAVFGLTNSRKEAMELKEKLDSKHFSWRTFVVSTY